MHHAARATINNRVTVMCIQVSRAELSSSLGEQLTLLQWKYIYVYVCMYIGEGVRSSVKQVSPVSAFLLCWPIPQSRWDTELAWGGNCLKCMFNYVFLNLFLYYCVKWFGVHMWEGFWVWMSINKGIIERNVSICLLLVLVTVLVEIRVWHIVNFMYFSYLKCKVIIIFLWRKVWYIF